MRLGYVRGHVVLSPSLPSLTGTTLLIVEPVTADHLAARDGLGGGRSLIVADRLGPGLGALIAFVEGAEAANPYHPGTAPVDAYCALVVRDYEFESPDPAVRRRTEGQ
jgi:microcompartment protein CcmK/EutM